MLELVGDFFGRKECVVAGISGGGPPGAHEAGGAPRGGGRALDPRGQVLAPPDVFSVPNILKYSRKKSYFNFRAFGKLLFSGYFFIGWIIKKTDRKILFFLYLI